MPMSTETYNQIMPFASVTKVAEADFPTRWGHFRILGFEGLIDNPAACNDNIPAPAVRIASVNPRTYSPIPVALPIVSCASRAILTAAPGGAERS